MGDARGSIGHETRAGPSYAGAVTAVEPLRPGARRWRPGGASAQAAMVCLRLSTAWREPQCHRQLTRLLTSSAPLLAP